jgi:hypothetical protein
MVPSTVVPRPCIAHTPDPLMSAADAGQAFGFVLQAEAANAVAVRELLPPHAPAPRFWSTHEVRMFRQ